MNHRDDRDHNNQPVGDYIPALRYASLTSLYDLLVRWTVREITFKRRLVRQARIDDSHRVLDLGCGTATLSILIKEAHPGAEVVGIDADPGVLEIAARKVARSCLSITLDRGMAFALPYPDMSFDRVLSSLVFHHLTREQKLGALREVLRVVRPGGELHLADWGKATNGIMRFAFVMVQILDGFQTTRDNVQGYLPIMIRRAGFQGVKETVTYATLFGTLSLYSAWKPPGSEKP